MPLNPEQAAPEEDIYTDGPQSNEAPAQEEQSEEGSEEQTENEPEARLPKSVLAGKDFKPGDEIVLQITGIDEDSVRVKYAPSRESDTPEPEGEAPQAPDEMASMME